MNSRGRSSRRKKHLREQEEATEEGPRFDLADDLFAISQTSRMKFTSSQKREEARPRVQTQEKVTNHAGAATLQKEDKEIQNGELLKTPHDCYSKMEYCFESGCPGMVIRGLMNRSYYPLSIDDKY